jgi:Fe-S-cluster-containing hydrogenase component 2
MASAWRDPLRVWQQPKELESELKEAKGTSPRKPTVGKLALVDYKKCDPGGCEGGICVAALACPRKLLQQEAPYEAPMTDPSTCRGCGDCVLACPLKAIEVVTSG